MDLTLQAPFPLNLAVRHKGGKKKNKRKKKEKEK
jgi:hypothetical protein